MKRLGFAALGLALVGFAAYLLATQPRPRDDSGLAELTGDAARGTAVFAAAGCASCHMAPDATGEAKLILTGGQSFPTAFGTFFAPNISPDPDHGIGGWTVEALGHAIRDGISPEGAHYFPALPYAAYQHMTDQDLADLWAYMQSLPPSAEPSKPHEVGFPFSIRRNLGGWKLLFLNDDWVLETAATPEVERGRYIAEALAHCGECHTPRNALGGLDRSRWLGGAPNPSGQGRIPNITPGGLNWSEDEIVEYLTSGFTPDFDSVGGHMAHVVENMASLPEADRRAVAAYLKAVPAVAAE